VTRTYVRAAIAFRFLAAVDHKGAILIPAPLAVSLVDSPRCRCPGAITAPFGALANPAPATAPAV